MGFAKAVIRVVQSNHDELPLLREELQIPIEGTEVDQVLVGEAIKRRRMTSKQPLSVEPQMEETETEERLHKDSHSKRLKDLFGELAKLAPRVGSVVVGRDSSSFGVAQEFCDVQLKHAEICRGTERLRVPKAGTMLEGVDLRKTFSLSRSTGEIEQVGEVEEWKKLPQRQRIRKGIPSRLTLTLFGAREDMTRREVPEEKVIESEMDGDRKRKLLDDQENETKRVKADSSDMPMVLGDDQKGLDEPVVKPPNVEHDEEISGRPPKNLARHGPGFLNLDTDKQKWLKQIHHRLGHPDAETMVRYLRSTNAEQAVVEGARNFQCDACVEARKGFDLPKAGAIHEDLGFNHTIGMDGVIWTNSNGNTFEFTHVIDGGTLFQIARPGGTDSQTQWNFLEDHWFGWAGYPRVLYVDPAKGYLSEHWLSKTQELGIVLKVSARDSHWQFGRVEAHGAILEGDAD